MTPQGIIVGNALWDCRWVAPKGISYTLRPATPVASLLDTVQGGQGTNGRITLAKPAPAGGQVVQLFGTHSLQLPAQVTVPAGSRTATFHVQTVAISTYDATITAYIGRLGASTPLHVVA